MEKKKKLHHWQIINIGLFIFDILAINFSYLFALFLRFDFIYSRIPMRFLTGFIKVAPVYTVFTIIIFYLLKMYKSLWRFASVEDLFKGVYAFLITGIFHVLVTMLIFERMPISYYIVGALLQFFLTTGIRFAYRIFLLNQSNKRTDSKEIKNVLIIGAGEAGRMIAQDMRRHVDVTYDIKGFIDDNSNKWGRYIFDLPIFGGRDEIINVANKYEINLIVLAIPSASKENIKDFLDIAKDTQATLKILPSLPDLINKDQVKTSQLKDVEIEDLLGRDQIKINTQNTLNNLKNKTVLVTGGGGSIGSELCRQVATNSPKKLIIFDIYENNAYEIEQELKRNYPDLDFIALIGSVREAKRLDDIFEEYKPDIVYHAAAHKHVPLMESSPNEAIKNNIYGTYNTAYAALRHKVDKFILISTDKAVNPTNVMGATKRACEMIIQMMENVSKNHDDTILSNFKELNREELRLYDNNFVTKFVAVRFGNVLGSNGSVIPIFKQQIAEGGPVTVTHKEIIRYFMTISEAVGLVIEAGFNANGGEIFVLDMGEPVKIDTLARNLIKLSGLKPDIDIEIKYTGLRPGEKLYEEKLMDEEGLNKTENHLIHIAQPLKFENKRLIDDMEEMSIYASKNEVDKAIEVLTRIVPTYHTPESDLNDNKEKFAELYKESK
ncbi:nucleoside-diphosphate sugar epimerase/dehydratase [Helcococcus sueciensis]|uniref:nucleoside-diphosphate sugar epimerase/dehydratase n=1 Tax=Helcococcus sueciensis TaxID=241555 RepID=UPI000424E862|nr:nucleoside-diphosphate sugar epimerase/dehydratase [Helcococcus sueciensis]